MRKATMEAILGLIAADPPTEADRAYLSPLLAMNAPQRPDKVLRYKDAAIRLGCTRRNVIRLVKQGKLTPIKLPGQVRASGVKESQLDAILAA